MQLYVFFINFCTEIYSNSSLFSFSSIYRKKCVYNLLPIIRPYLDNYREKDIEYCNYHFLNLTTLISITIEALYYAIICNFSFFFQGKTSNFDSIYRSKKLIITCTLLPYMYVFIESIYVCVQKKCLIYPHKRVHINWLRRRR